jgi:hypothetical protein
MIPRKSNLLGVSSSCLHLGFQTQLWEVIEWSHSPLENLRLHPLPDSEKPRGLWSQQEQLQQQWALLWEGEDVKTGFDDPITR